MNISLVVFLPVHFKCYGVSLKQLFRRLFYLFEVMRQEINLFIAGEVCACMFIMYAVLVLSQAGLLLMSTFSLLSNSVIISIMNFCCVLSRYGGIYLDSDIIVLKSLSSLSNSVGMEDRDNGRSLNGAVMAFRRHRYSCYCWVYLFILSFSSLIVR